jgi:hypothetical protein
MRNLQKMRDRFLRDDRTMRLGNLASDFLRLSLWVQKRHQNEALIDLMREIAWLLEWSGDLGLAELADMQREICSWRRRWPDESARSSLVVRASQISDRLIELSGLPTRS